MFRKTTVAALVMALMGTLLIVPAQADSPAANEVVLQESEDGSVKAAARGGIRKEVLMKITDSYLKKQRKKNKNLVSAKVVDMKEMSLAAAEEFTTLAKFRVRKRPFKVFYAAVDIRVKEEDKYRLNGINYRLIVFEKVQNWWEQVEYTVIPVDGVVRRGIGFGTADEKQMAEIFKQRYRGVYLNRQWKRIEEVNEASPEDLRKEMAGIPVTKPTMAEMNVAAATSKAPAAINPYYPRPKWIRVLMTQPANKKFYGCKVDCVQKVDFLEYCKNVLPYEWRESKTTPAESLKAGALAIKMFSWYAVAVDSRFHSQNADVKDTEASQVYRAVMPKDKDPKRVAELKRLFHTAGVAGVGFKDGLTHDLFEAQYHRNYDWQRSGQVSQLGSERLGKLGYDHTRILSYYYQGSRKLPHGARLEFFRYAK